MMESYEIAGQHPLLFSLPSQVNLGIIKDMRNGKVAIGDNDGNNIQLYRSHLNGLFAIEIGHLQGDYVVYFPEEIMKLHTSYQFEH